MGLEVALGARVFAVTFVENTLDGKPVGSEIFQHTDGFSIIEKVGLLEMLKQKLLNENEKALKDGDEKQEQSTTTG